MSNHNPASVERLLSFQTVCEMTTVSRTTIWRMVRAGAFPKPIKVSANRKAWRGAEVKAWLERYDDVPGV
jgi:prophage regulatory protein